MGEKPPGGGAAQYPQIAALAALINEIATDPKAFALLLLSAVKPMLERDSDAS